MDHRPSTIDKHIYIIGPMGSGKTKIGKELAAKLGIPFVDLDQYIEAATGKTIKELFETEGEPYFRGIESQYLKELATQPAAVVSLGGGTPCFFNNMTFLKKTGKTVYLQTPVGILVSRLAQAKTPRPLLAGKNEAAIKDFMEKQLQQREKFYLKADHIVQNDGKLKAVDLVAVLN